MDLKKIIGTVMLSAALSGTAYAQANYPDTVITGGLVSITYRGGLPDHLTLENSMKSGWTKSQQDSMFAIDARLMYDFTKESPLTLITFDEGFRILRATYEIKDRHGAHAYKLTGADSLQIKEIVSDKERKPSI